MRRDEQHLAACMGELPGLWYLAGTLAPAKGAAKIRTPPGSRVLVNVGADALRQETAAITAGWAARVRHVPGLQLSAPQHPVGTPARMAEDCKVLATHTAPLLALERGWTSRTYDFPDGTPRKALDRTSARCRLCGRMITRSAVSGWWWAPPRGEHSIPTLFCDHDPDPATAVTQAPPPAAELPDGDVDEDAGEEVITEGDGWVRVMRKRDGTAAATELLDVHYRCRRASGTAPAPPQPLDGVPCRECEEITLVRADAPADPRTEAMWSRCTACGDFMDKEEFDDWAAMYDAWAKGAGELTCRRCQLGRHETCYWDSCSCRAAGHSAAA